MLPRYRRRRFREDDDDDESITAVAAARASSASSPAHVAAASSSPAAAVVAAASTRRSKADASDDESIPPEPHHPAPLQLDNGNSGGDDGGGEIVMLDEPDQSASAAAAATASASPDDQVDSTSLTSPTAAIRRKMRRSLEGTGLDARGRKPTASVFVQRWSADQVQEAYQRLFALLYPKFEPALDVDPETMDSSLALLLDEWTDVIRANTKSVLLEDVRAIGRAGKYQMAVTDRRCPLVIGSEQLRELVAAEFEPPTLSADGCTSAEQAQSSSLEEDETTAAEDAAAEKNGVQASKERVQMQTAVRPFLEQMLSLHDVTPAGSSLRDRLREVLSVLAAVSYGFEMHLFACCLDSFKFMPSASVAPGTIQMLLAHVCHLCFTFQNQMDQTSREALSKFLLLCFRSHMATLTPALHLSMLEAALCNDLDAECTEMLSDLLMPFVMQAVPSKAQSWCSCGRGGPDSLTAATPNEDASITLGSCALCQRQKQDEQTASVRKFAALIVQRMVDSVSECNSLKSEINKFHRSSAGAALSASIVSLSSLFCPPVAATSSRSRSATRDASAPHMLCNLLLLGCNWALPTCNPTDATPSSIQRQEQGLRLVLLVLQQSGGFLFSSPALLQLLRHALPPVLLSCLLHSFTPELEAVFRLGLEVFTHLFEHGLAYLVAEVNTLILHALLPMIEGPFATLRQKQAILEFFRSVLRSPRRVMVVFVNADFHSSGSHVLEKLFGSLMHLLEGGGAESLPCDVANLPEGIRAGAAGEENEVTDASLAQTALRLLVHLLFMQAQWSGVPGLKRQPGGAVPPALPAGQTNKDSWKGTLQQHRRENQIEEQVLQLARSGKIKAALRYRTQVKPCSGSMEQMARYLQETEGLDAADVGDFLANLDDDFLSKADYICLRRAYVRSLGFQGMSFDGALRKFLCEGGFRLPGEAQKIDRMLEAFCEQFCEENPRVFRNASSAFIVCFALVMLNTDLHDPRLRSGKSSRSPMSLAAFMSNLRGVDDGRDFPPEFLKNMYGQIKARGIEWKEDLPEATSKKGKKAVQLSAAQRKKAQLEAAHRAAGQLRRIVERRMSFALLTQQTWSSPRDAWLVAPLFDATCFRALATISLLAEQTASVEGCLSLCLDGLAYGTCLALMLGGQTEFNAFLAVLAKLTFVEKARSEHRVQLLYEDIQRRQHAHVNASASASPNPSLSPPAPAASATAAVASPAPVAAPVSRAEHARQFAASMERAVSARAHLKQAWFKRLSADSSLAQPEQTCRGVFTLCSQTKQQLRQEQRYVRVQQLQDAFGDGVALYCPGRELLKEGLLWRFKTSDALHSAMMQAAAASAAAASGDLSSSASSASAASSQFIFFLFTDLLVWASVGGEEDGGYKFKHALHLSMLRRVDNNDAAAAADEEGSAMFPFTFTTPQSSTPLFLAAPDDESRTQWLSLIDAQRALLRQRQTDCAPLQALPRSKRLSRFVGAPLALQLDPLLEVVPASSHCKLCLRAFHPLFRRAGQCSWCGEHVCSACCSKRIRLSPEMLLQCSVQQQPREQETPPPFNAVDAANLQHSSPSPPPASASATAKGRSLSASIADSPAPVAASSSSSFLSKLNSRAATLNSAAAASVASMQSRFQSGLRSALAKLNEKEGVAVCDACKGPVQREASKGKTGAGGDDGDLQAEE